MGTDPIRYTTVVDHVTYNSGRSAAALRWRSAIHNIVLLLRLRSKWAAQSYTLTGATTVARRAWYSLGVALICSNTPYLFDKVVRIYGVLRYKEQ